MNIFKLRTAILLRLLAPLVLSMAPLAIAQEEREPAAALVEILGRTESMRAEVEQLTLDQNGREIQESEATLVMRKPDHFHWHATAPYEEVMVTDGDRIWIYEPDLEQVTVQPFSDDLSRTPALLLSEDEQTLVDSFDIQREDFGGGRQSFLLAPRDPGSLFESLTLSFDGDILEQMHFEDSLGQKTSLNFRAVETNVDVDEDFFRFEPPEGVDVIDSTGVAE